MSLIPKVRRAYGAPTSYIMGGGELHGLGGCDFAMPPTRAERCDNLYRLPDGTLSKRPGAVPIATFPGVEKIAWHQHFDAFSLLAHFAGGVWYLRRYQNGSFKDRAVGDRRPVFLTVGDTKFVFCREEWIVFSGEECHSVLEDGICPIDYDSWNSANIYEWSLDQTFVPVPTVRVGTSTEGAGRRVLPPGILCPAVCESFVYTAQDRQIRRNRFCLALPPLLRGNLGEDAAERIQTLTASAKLELRLERTDEYGNTESYWQQYAWQAQDNINPTAAAFWVKNIHEAALSGDGEDNVRITYFNADGRRRQMASELLSSDVFTRFGVAGQRDRLFTAAGKRIFYSGMDMPLYFGILQYLEVEGNVRLMTGEDTVMTVLSDNGAWRIVGAAAPETDDTAYVLDAIFSISARLPLPAPVMGSTATVAGGEVLFLTEMGVCAVTPTGVLDERRVQLRSRRLEAVWNAAEITDGVWGRWGQYVVIATDTDRWFLLDIERKVAVQNDAFSTHGYEAYCWQGLHADAFAVQDGELAYFDGDTLYALDASTAVDRIRGTERAIRAMWQTPFLNGGEHRCTGFYALTVTCPDETALQIEYALHGTEWKPLLPYSGAFRCFHYAPFHYGQWNYGTFRHPAVRFRIPFSHNRGLALRFTNDVAGQGLKLQEFMLEMK